VNFATPGNSCAQPESRKRTSVRASPATTAASPILDAMGIDFSAGDAAAAASATTRCRSTSPSRRRSSSTTGVAEFVAQDAGPLRRARQRADARRQRGRERARALRGASSGLKGGRDSDQRQRQGIVGARVRAVSGARPRSSARWWCCIRSASARPSGWRASRSTTPSAIRSIPRSRCTT